MGFPTGVRHSAIVRDQARCRHCRLTEREVDLQVHHIVPEARGGNDRLTNAATLCLDCHMSTHGHIRVESTNISDTDIQSETANRLLQQKADLLKEREDKIAECRKEIDTLREQLAVETDRNSELTAKVGALNEENNQLAQQIHDHYEKIDNLRTKINHLRSKDMVPQQRYDQLRDEHQLMFDVLWQQSEPPLPADQTSDDETSLFQALISKLKL